MQIIWNLSNILSLARLFLSIPACVFLFSGDNILVFVIFCLAAITDILDGYVARRKNQITEFGKIIDPLADKIFISTVVISLLIQNKIPVWFFILVVAKDLFVLAGGLIITKIKKLVPQSNNFGKAAVISIGFTFIVILFEFFSREVKEYFIIFTSFLIILSFLIYFKSFISFLKPGN